MNRALIPDILTKRPKKPLTEPEVAQRLDAIFELHGIKKDSDPHALIKALLLVATDHFDGFKATPKKGGRPVHEPWLRLLLILDFARLYGAGSNLKPEGIFKRMAKDSYWKANGYSNWKRIKNHLNQYEKSDVIAGKMDQLLSEELKISNPNISAEDHAKIRQILNLK